jgi:hypothetical protein
MSVHKKYPVCSKLSIEGCLLAVLMTSVRSFPLCGDTFVYQAKWFNYFYVETVKPFSVKEYIQTSLYF